MKVKIFFIIALLNLGLCSSAQIKKASLQASGLTCAMCAKSVYTSLTSLSFVESVDTDLNASAFEIKFKDGQHIDPEAIRKKVEDAGFSVSKLHLEFDASNHKIEHDTHLKVGNSFYHFVNVKSKEYNGPITLHVIDKEYLSSKDHKKIAGGSNLDCYNPGNLTKCVVPNHEVHSLNIYHVTIK
jgi:copper chaperone CopZ